MPGLCDWVIFFSAVWVYRNRQICSGPKFPDQTDYICRFGAINSYHFQMRILMGIPGKCSCTLCNLCALINVFIIPTGETDPVICPHFFRDFSLYKCLSQRRLCFKQKQICPCFPQKLHSVLMKFIKSLFGHFIMPPIF